MIKSLDILPKRKAYERKVVVLRKEDFIRKEHFILLLPVLNSFICLIIHYTTFVRKDFKPFCAKFRPVGLKNLNKTFLSYEKCSFCKRNVPSRKERSFRYIVILPQ